MKAFQRCLLASAAIVTVTTAHANESVQSNISDMKNWATQLGNYEGHRYSALDQITVDNVANLRPAWTFSTGVLRG
ncbi:MAG TPA: PQQ-dependent dehydrogenase, methanol/ethanol family, partial [Arenibaculum sp.]|nr:PQQ-dependent dehydrogenase, methanol/ethanol family [Arenibaculum sp.]